MENVKNIPVLDHIFDRVKHYAYDVYERKLPEMRFFVLDNEEFICLLNKHVYPVSAPSIWEGKDVMKQKNDAENGRESGIIYEVVQTGNPSYAYLNHCNSPTTQAAVMSHVVGHCEFSELNLLNDSDEYRTEKIMFLVKQIERAIPQMGYDNYMIYRNRIESLTSFVYPHSPYNLENSVESKNQEVDTEAVANIANEQEENFEPYSFTLSKIFEEMNSRDYYKEDIERKNKNENIDRFGYRLKAPCQDILGFLCNYAPASTGEKLVLDYIYKCNYHTEFIMKTQIMNEGWAMYWQKKIMLDLFSEGTVGDIIDHSKMFSGVCYPRPFFARNPYHLGYNLWLHIEDDLKKGKMNVDYLEEKDLKIKNEWDKPPKEDPLKSMERMVSTLTDYEFIRRYLSEELIEEFKLNNVPFNMIQESQDIDDYVKNVDVKKGIAYFYPGFVKNQMLKNFVDYGRPLIYIIDNDYEDGGLLLYHRDVSNRPLKKEWIYPTLDHIREIWKAPVVLYSRESLYFCSASNKSESNVKKVEWEKVLDNMKNNKKIKFKGE